MTQRPKYAPKGEDGMCAYVREVRSWGHSYETIVWHPDFATAKREDGCTRMRHASVRVRRATVEDMERVRGGAA